jgi:hypothetical protein
MARYDVLLGSDHRLDDFPRNSILSIIFLEMIDLAEDFP